MPSKRKVPPPFLGRRKISNQHFSRHDALALAEDALVLNVTFENKSESGPNGPIVVAMKRLRDTKISINDNSQKVEDAKRNC